METRKVSVTLNKAREWYNSGNATLKEVALQAFTKEELTIPSWKDIKTFESACRALDTGTTFRYAAGTPFGVEKHMEAIWMIDIICKALNGNWKPSLVSGLVHYPWVKFYKEDDVPSDRKKDIANYFMYNGEKYALVGGDSSDYGYGLGYYFGGGGYCHAAPGLFGCKSKEIALHMSTHFAKEVFLACYAGKLNGEIEWLPY